ncbi:coiled-coil domain-containing protein [Oleiharenicola lentus]|uniref:coiled-coil domain-containing protein n=1 Tax=Oleiharenicola lentus TaxID=2508720 RepID=UPI003F6712A6
MSFLDQLPKTPIKKTPDVWVKRLVIFGRLQPKPDIIRDIPLRRGLNIIWAEEPESTTDKTDIAGHSAGKTTFCRLLRYVLGEKTYSNRAGMQAIKASFPNGYVAAEIMIEGVQWAVLRPLGENRNSWILRDGTVEQVATQKGEPAYQDSYPSQIQLARRVHGLRTATVVRTQEEIKWGHILAWCARDQEARFQNIYEWRSPRSESEWPSFRFPKADPLFVMRVVLGLYLPDELGTEELMAANLRKLEQTEANYESLKREPEFWRNHYDQRVRATLKARLPEDAEGISETPVLSGDLLPDLKKYVEKAKFLTQETLNSLHEEAEGIQQKLDAVNELIAATRADVNEIEALFALGHKAVGSIQSGLNQASQLDNQTEENRTRLCPFGDVIIGECSYVRERRRQILPNELRDTHSLEQMEAERANAQQRLSRQKSELQSKLETAERTRQQLNGVQRGLSERVQTLTNATQQLENDFTQLTEWGARTQAPEKLTKLRDAADKIASLKSVIETERNHLNQLLANHDSHRHLLSKIFSQAARLVLPTSAYDGRVNFENRELNFQITHGGTMNGEAMETLAVLLADLSCLVFNLLSADSHLPSFLLHDSPREADLAIRLYHNFINLVARLEVDLSDETGCPFQYILTTTTPPPDEVNIKKFVVLQLDASKENDLLFRRDLSRPPEAEELALPTS